MLNLLKIFTKKSCVESPKMTHDFLIVGQGLAGTLLALELEKRGKRVLVVDDAWASAASMVAAGVLNPVTGIRLTKTLGADDLLPAAHRIYAELEARYGKKFFHFVPFYRYYGSEHERAVKAQRVATEDYGDWLSDDVPAGTLCSGGLNDKLGGFFVRRTGWLDLPPLLKTVAEDLRSRGSLRNEVFGENELTVEKNGVRWRDVFARGVIYCNGFRARESKYFSHLRWQPAKGEYVELDLAGTEKFQEQILKGSVVAIPLGGSRWRVGSNYDREVLDSVPTKLVAEHLQRMALSLFAFPPNEVKIVAQRAGVRPAIAGAVPAVGPHQGFPRVFLFNGFGSKGTTWIPLYAERFAEKLLSFE